MKVFEKSDFFSGLLQWICYLWCFQKKSSFFCKTHLFIRKNPNCERFLRIFTNSVAFYDKFATFSCFQTFLFFQKFHLFWIKKTQVLKILRNLTFSGSSYGKFATTWLEKIQTREQPRLVFLRELFCQISGKKAPNWDENCAFHIYIMTPNIGIIWSNIGAKRTEGTKVTKPLKWIKKLLSPSCIPNSRSKKV